jgi:lipoprotein-anchoring transpeptidase ErfK/SrfK
MGRTALAAAALLLAAWAGLQPARAEIAAQIVAHVSLSKQTMVVTVDGASVYVWPVSTARRGYVTPRGSFKVQSMRKMHRSSLFNNAPMPYSIFYSGHYAIHGTTEIRRLGSPASAGCVRLHPDNARFLFDLVQQRGPQTLQIVVDG